MQRPGGVCAANEKIENKRDIVGQPPGFERELELVAVVNVAVEVWQPGCRHRMHNRRRSVGPARIRTVYRGCVAKQLRRDRLPRVIGGGTGFGDSWGRLLTGD